MTRIICFKPEMESETRVFDSGAIVVDYVANLQEETLREWIKLQLTDLEQPKEWGFPYDYDEIVWQQTTLIYCKFSGNETAESLVKGFSAIADFDDYLPHVMFVATHEGRWAVLGTLLAASFKIQKHNLKFKDLHERQTRKMFEHLSLFDQVDYYVLHGYRGTVRDPDLNLEEEIVQAYCKFQLGIGLEQWSLHHPVVFNWIVFIVSGNDRLAEQFINYECTQFKQRINKLASNPLLLFEYVKKWLRIDLDPFLLEQYRRSVSRPKLMEKDPLWRVTEFMKMHADAAYSVPSHCVFVPSEACPWQIVNTNCVYCESFHCVRCPNRRGCVMLPLIEFLSVGIFGLRKLLRNMIFRCRYKHRTYEGFDLWPVVGKDTSTEQIQEQIKNAMIELGVGMEENQLSAVQKSIRETIEALRDVRLFSERDYLIVHRVVLPFWKEAADTKQEHLLPFDEHPFWEGCRPPPEKKAQPNASSGFDFSSVTSRDLLFYELEKAPCMAKLAETCRGPGHAKNEERMILFYFICARSTSKKMAQQLVLWLFGETDVFLKECNGREEDFWRHDIGRSLEFVWDNYRKTDKMCRRIMEKGFCVHGTLEDTDDIEDLFQKGTQRCTEQLNDARNALELPPMPPNFRVFAPVRFNENL